MLIMLDWDGTLIDSAERIGECLVKAGQALENYEVEVEQAKQVIGLGLDEALRELYPYFDKTQLRQCREYYVQFFLEAEVEPNLLFEQVESTLQQLRDDGHILAIATGKSRRGLDRVLRQMQLEHLFDASRCADETASKPDPAMLLELMDEFQYEPHQCLMVGDTVFDMQMATQAGVRAVAVNYGVHEEQALLECQPYALIDQFDELLNVIEDIDLDVGEGEEVEE